MRRQVVSTISGMVQSDTEVIESKDIGEGMVMPTKFRSSRHDWTSSNKGAHVYDVTISDIELNTDIGDEEFAVWFLLGTRVVDHVAGEAYTVKFVPTKAIREGDGE